MTEQEIINYLKENKNKGVIYLFMPKEVQNWLCINYKNPKLLYLTQKGEWKSFFKFFNDHNNVVGFSLSDDYEAKEKSKGGWVEFEIDDDGFFYPYMGEDDDSSYMWCHYIELMANDNDFIFAVLAEELGFVGCAAVIILFLLFVWRGIVISMKAPDMFGSLMAIGITSLIGLQAIINIAVVTSSMPVTGIALPFFSYGGTSLIILLCAVGILLNISRHAEKI